MAFDHQHVYEQNGAYKPRGFWVSVQGEHDWPDWCYDEGWKLDSLKHAYRVALKPTACVLVINTLAGLDKFHCRYTQRRQAHDLRHREVDWTRVREQHDGLIIAPYRHERRLEYMWYYGWDCASGVIWDLTAVDSVRLARPTKEDV